MRCIENISLKIKVFKSLFVQVIDDLNFWHTDDNSVTIPNCLPKRRRIFFLKSLDFCWFSGATKRRSVDAKRVWWGGRKKLALENICNSVDFAWFSGVNKRWVIRRRQQSVKGDY